jgi:Fic family protein
MVWNWQLPDWPRFTYDPTSLHEKERQFLLSAGKSFAYLKSTGEREYKQYIVEILSSEGQESSRIEGELLDRESLQSSIKRQFGLPTQTMRGHARESGMAKLLHDVYTSSEEPLTHAMVGRWHEALFSSNSHIDCPGRYRTHAEPMQIVSHRYGSSRVFFEAPPPAVVSREMDSFVRWFNAEKQPRSILAKAAIAHVYFESIHPFEDGNGRIGRALVEKVLAQGVGQPLLIAVSRVLEKNKKDYYGALERCNRTLEVTPWVVFFADMILRAQD